MVSLKEAREKGLRHYFTGLACKRGHVSERITINQTCRDCVLENRKRYYHSDLPSRRFKSRQYYGANTARILASGHKSKLKSRYGLTVSDFENMMANQNGRCAICKKQDKRRLCLDHCHKTGRPRMLLCNSCNVGLGAFKDTPELLIAATNYLNVFNFSNLFG